MRLKNVFKCFMGLAIVLFVLPNFSFADTAAVTTTPTSSDIYEINNATPGTRKVNLGYRLQGSLQTGPTTQSTTNAAGTCSSRGYSSPFTRTYFVTLDSGARGDFYCLGDGYQNETLTYVMVATTNSQKFRISPNTKKGFASIDLTAANASVTLVFSDTTNGWAISGTTPTGVTVN